MTNGRPFRDENFTPNGRPFRDGDLIPNGRPFQGEDDVERPEEEIEQPEEDEEVDNSMDEAEAPDPDGNDYTEVDAGDVTREPEEDVISGEPDAPANDAGDVEEVTSSFQDSNELPTEEPGGFSVVSEEDVIEKEVDVIEEEMVEDIDPIIGGKRSDELLGSERNDKILGKKGNDTLDGGLGDDVLDGGKGDDILTGGEGADTFKVSKGDDVITDFVLGLDTFKGRLKKAEVTVLDTGDSLIEHKRGSILLEGLELTANELLL